MLSATAHPSRDKRQRTNNNFVLVLSNKSLLPIFHAFRLRTAMSSTFSPVDQLRATACRIESMSTLRPQHVADADHSCEQHRAYFGHRLVCVISALLISIPKPISSLRVAAASYSLCGDCATPCGITVVSKSCHNAAERCSRSLRKGSSRHAHWLRKNCRLL